MKRSIVVVAALTSALVACGNSKDKPSAGSGSSSETGSGSGSAAVASVTKSGSGAGSGSQAKPADTKGKHVVTPPTKQQLADYRKHVKAGWAMQKQSKWAEAVPEFEKALVAIDGDQRALTELGFSAMNAGDFVKARKADEQAIQVAVDKKVKAMALYNLGLVQEKTNDTAGALRSYVASLALRPNKTVEKAVGRLGTSPEADKPFCDKGQKPCDCALAYGFGDSGPDGDSDNPPKCEEATDVKSPVDGWHVYHISRVFHAEDWYYLLDENNRLVAPIKGGYEYRHGRVFDMFELDSGTVQTIGGHKILRLQTHDTLEETQPSGDNDEDMKIDGSERVLVTICEIGAGGTRCPLSEVPISETKSQDGKTTKTVLDLAISPDGTATVKLVSGASDEAIDKLVGPHKLW